MAVIAEMQSDPSASIRPSSIPRGERRASARVPLDRPVRIGLPGGLPYATVAARDVSSGGVFIDAERNVRVGARFSVEVSLEDDQRVYISEAEVVDNRSCEDGGGFGVRFVSLSHEAVRVLEEHIAERSCVTVPEGLDGPTPNSSEADDWNVSNSEMTSVPPDLSLYEELEPVHLDMESFLPSTQPIAARTPTVRVRSRTRWSKMKAWFRSFPGMSGALYALTAIVLLLLSIAVLWTDTGESTQVVSATHRTVTPDVHARLVEGTDPSGVSTPLRVPTNGALVNRLPDKVPVSEDRAARPRPQLARASSLQDHRPEEAPAVRRKPEKEAASRGPGAADVPSPGPLVRTSGNRSPRREPATATGPVRAATHKKQNKASNPSRTLRAEGSASKKRDPRGERGSARRDEGSMPKPSVKVARRTSKPQPKLRSKAAATSGARLSISVDSGSRVKSQYILREPDRFVIDVTGLSLEPKLPAGGGRVERVRFGRHDGFVRFVVDTRAPLRKGHAAIRHARLELSLGFR